jgi:hypothetical protein
MTVVRSDDQVLAFDRAADGQRLRCTFNLSDRQAQFSTSGNPLVSVGRIDGAILGAYAAQVEEIA